jgi:hypothetical protein
MLPDEELTGGEAHRDACPGNALQPKWLVVAEPNVPKETATCLFQVVWYGGSKWGKSGLAPVPAPPKG